MATVQRDDEFHDVDGYEPDPSAEVLAFPATRAPLIGGDDGERPLCEVIGDVLRDERHMQQRTLAETAREAHVSLAYLSEIERGRKEPSSQVLGSICAALDLPLADVLERCADRLRAGVHGHCRVQLLAA